MNTTPRCLLKIRQLLPGFNGKYRAIADFILNNPGQVVGGKARDIAASCDCDESQIIRFCQKLGYSGFSELKASIAAGFMPVAIQDSGDDDSFANIKRDFLNNNLKTVNDTVGLIDEQHITEAARAITTASRIYLLASGASAMAAGDAQLKLLRLGFNVVFSADSAANRLLHGLVNPGDTVLAISHSGETPEVCELAAKAKSAGVTVIAITNFPQSSLAKTADILLLTASDEQSFRLAAMTSRLAQCLIIDFLVIHIAMQDLAGCEEKILRTHEMIKPR